MSQGTPASIGIEALFSESGVIAGSDGSSQSETPEYLKGEVVRLSSECQKLSEQLAFYQVRAENWEKLCTGLKERPDVAVDDLLNGLRLQESDAIKWHQAFDTLREGGMEFDEEQFLAMIVQLVVAKKKKA